MEPLAFVFKLQMRLVKQVHWPKFQTQAVQNVDISVDEPDSKMFLFEPESNFRILWMR